MGTWASGVLQRELAADPASAGVARSTVSSALRTIDCGELLDIARLLVTELVANAVHHGDPPMWLRVAVESDTIRIAVGDGSTETPVQPPPDDQAEHGRGVLLIQAMANRWGVDHTAPGAGKSVWFELDRPPSAGVAGPAPPPTSSPRS